MAGFDDENSESTDSGGSSKVPKRLEQWIKNAQGKGQSLFSRLRSRGERPGSSRRFEFKKPDLKKVAENSNKIRWGLIVLTLFLLAEITARLIGMAIKPVTPPAARRSVQPSTKTTSNTDYDAILRRNMFNVEQKIPAPFDQGQLDCLSQARASSQRILLMGTIVMNDENHSVALIQLEGKADKTAVKKDETFSDGQLVAKKVERKKLCFQVKSTGDFEYIEIPDDSVPLGVSAGLAGSNPNITPTSDKSWNVDKIYLKKSLENLNNIVQTARATGYNDPSTGKFAGFLIQSIEPDSPFAALGVQRGDILTFVNNIQFDNMGRGLEALNTLRDAQVPKITMGIIRNGEKTTLSYDIK